MKAREESSAPEASTKGEALLPPPLPSQADTLLSRTMWFVQMRWLAIIGVFAVIAAAQGVFRLSLSAAPLYACACLLLASNFVFWRWGRRVSREKEEETRSRKARRFANCQIVSDLVLLTALLHYSGGVENPFSVFFVFHMVLASILLSPLASYLHATFAIALFGGMATAEYLWPAFHHPMVGFTPVELSGDWLYVASHVAALGAALYIAVFLTSSVSAQLREREAQLHEATQRMEELVWALTDSNLRLLQLEERQSRFMRVAAHQLRSPPRGHQELPQTRDRRISEG